MNPIARGLLVEGRSCLSHGLNWVVFCRGVAARQSDVICRHSHRSDTLPTHTVTLAAVGAPPGPCAVTAAAARLRRTQLPRAPIARICAGDATRQQRPPWRPAAAAGREQRARVRTAAGLVLTGRSDCLRRAAAVSPPGRHRGWSVVGHGNMMPSRGAHAHGRARRGAGASASSKPMSCGRPLASRLRASPRPVIGSDMTKAAADVNMPAGGRTGTTCAKGRRMAEEGRGAAKPCLPRDAGARWTSTSINRSLIASGERFRPTICPIVPDPAPGCWGCTVRNVRSSREVPHGLSPVTHKPGPAWVEACSRDIRPVGPYICLHHQRCSNDSARFDR
eukprot:scaffold4868_cov416-Prasinococcus_capsulatus_cf.AAC.30